MTTTYTREDLDYLVFQKRIKDMTGIDLAAYKRPQMERRLRSLITQSGATSFRMFLHLLEKSPQLLDEFRTRMTINVSEFLRNPDKFEELQSKILPALRGRSRSLRVWSAGCSYGAEAYSLAIIFHELPSGALKSPILATDIDTEILQRAREGVFTDADLKNVSGARKRRHFAPVAGGWRVGDHLRPSVEFRRHDLIADAFERGFDLILCRNVVIYFTDEAKAELYRRLWTSLTPGGVLFIGGTEHIIDSRQIGFEPISSFFYRKPAPGAPE